MRKQSIPQSQDKRATTAVAYAQLFSTEQGKAVLADLEAVAAMDKSGFVPGSTDTTAYNLGRKDVVLQIKQKITRGLSHGKRS